MKTIVRNIGIYSFSLFILTQVLSGIKVSGGVTTYIIAGVVLSIMFLIIKPILSIITLPLNIITLGLFSFLINAIILYLLTVLVKGISVSHFVFKGFSFAGFVVPSVTLNTFFAFIIASLFLSIFVGFLTWLIKK
ncbi:MAG: phage holin family protein [Patescibacteria group bacterium]